MQQGKFFAGVTPGTARQGLAKLVKQRHQERAENDDLEPLERAYVPCAGEFASSRIYANTLGAENVYASDIMLYPSLCGYVLSGKNLLALGVEINDPEDDKRVMEFDWDDYMANPDDYDSDDVPDIRRDDMVWDTPWSEWVRDAMPDTDRLSTRANDWNDDPSAPDDDERDAAFEYAARVALTQHFFAMDRGNYFIRDVANEVGLHRDRYAKNAEEDLRQMESNLGGINYEIEDIRNVCAEHCWDEDALISCNPPAYKSGYEKMYDTGGRVVWDQPTLDQFNPNERQVMLDEFADKPADMVYCLNVADIFNEQFETDGWDKWFVRKYSVKRNEYQLANWDTGLSIVDRTESDMEEGNIPIWQPDDWCNKHSEVQFAELSPGVSQYYRNLFLKQLDPGVSAELNGAFLIDGKMIGVVGINFGIAAKDGKPYVYEVYGITPVYDELPKPINRLLMRFLISHDFRRELEQVINFGTADLEGIKTTCISRHPEVRINNGLLDTVHREQRDDGKYKIQYYSDFEDKSYQQQIVEYRDECDRYRDIIRDRGETERADGLVLPP